MKKAALKNFANTYREVLDLQRYYKETPTHEFSSEY